MNKAELIAAVAEHVELPKKTVAAVLDGILDVIPMVVAADDQVALAGFGTFESVDIAERTARNPGTGAEITVSASRRPKFRPGSNFKVLVNVPKPAADKPKQLIPA